MYLELRSQYLLGKLIIGKLDSVYLHHRLRLICLSSVQPEYQEIQKMYVENLTSSYPNYTIEGNYYWSGFSRTLCIILGAIWAFNLYKLFTGYNTFKTLGIDMFWSTINIGGRSLPRPITLFFNKLALLALTALLIAFCYLDLVCCDLDSRKDKRNSDSNLQICLSTAQLFFCL